MHIHGPVTRGHSAGIVFIRATPRHACGIARDIADDFVTRLTPPRSEMQTTMLCMHYRRYCLCSVALA